jgi:hypothetical protein
LFLFRSNFEKISACGIWRCSWHIARRNNITFNKVDTQPYSERDSKPSETTTASIAVHTSLQVMWEPTNYVWSQLSWQNHYDNTRGRILPMNGTVHFLSVIQ